MTVQPEPSLQQRYAPTTRCFGCGPANERGLRIESRLAAIGDAGTDEAGTGEAGTVAAHDGELVATWQPLPHHAAFENVLNGGVIGTLLDCHSNWAAAVRIMRDRALDHPPGCVTADYAVRLRRPTPVDRPLTVRAWPIESEGDRVVVDAEIAVDGIITATCRGTFVAVGPDHPAYERW